MDLHSSAISSLNSGKRQEEAELRRRTELLQQARQRKLDADSKNASTAASTARRSSADDDPLLQPQPRSSPARRSITYDDPMLQPQPRSSRATDDPVQKWHKEARECLQKAQRGISKFRIMEAEELVEEALELGILKDDAKLFTLQQLLHKAAVAAEEEHHPTRTELVAQEPENFKRQDEGTHAKKGLFADNEQLENSVTDFLGLLKIKVNYEELPESSNHQDTDCWKRPPAAAGASNDTRQHLDQISLPTATILAAKQSDHQEQQLSEAVSQVWKYADADGDGLLQSEEAKEIIRTILACPQLQQTVGNPLCESFSQWMSEDERLAEILAAINNEASKKGPATLVQICRRSVSRSCLDVVRKLPDVTNAFWGSMDLDQNLEVDGDEFKKFFFQTTVSHLISPLFRISWDRVGDIVLSSAWRAQSYADLDRRVRKWKRLRKQPKLPPPPTPRENCGACASDACGPGDCVVC